MARTSLTIRIELVSGRGADFWPRPGRDFAAARSHTFDQLATAIDLAFARWDLAHMHSFTLADGTPVTPLDLWDGDAPEGSIDSEATRLSRLAAGEQFAYLFDFGDDWTHLCTVAEHRIDPEDTLGAVPPEPTPFYGLGDLPDQYQRRWPGDDGDSAPPKRPRNPMAGLPPLLPWWGPRDHGK
ncbi:IS1096 element passenger TnpR family protein [Mangrovihabitans endophyticus]|uniref:Plasmid pRiA4b Orf3-like domain-containing protein n=1 Tax=Mangrovihabitans endophyticus TaxID=1751298 RepID=A0A8J3C6V8_9ACTN|nr:hypothetical protein [Mangrovihabitans endophyticus]GGL21600.1 hypothetical protein GCM10012284_65220 [Mangrovihabitans endophyticus]